MKFFAGLISYYLKLNFSFGVSVFIKLISRLIFFSIQVTLWSYVLQDNELVVPIYQYFTFAAIITSLISFNTDRLIQSKYENGAIINFLIKPYSFYMLLFIEDFSRSVISLLFTGIPVLAVSYFLFDIFHDISFLGLSFFFISVFLSYLISWCIYFMTGLSIVFFKNNEGIIQFRMFFITLFSGSMIPIYLIPEPWKSVFYALPFHNLVDTPVTILLSPNPVFIQEKLLFQLVWCFIFIFLTSLVYKNSIAKMEILGG